MAKQPIKTEAEGLKKAAIKKSSIEFDLDLFKEDNGIVASKDKELTWFTLSDAFQEITKLPGIPKGYFSMVYGYPNTGKSTLKLELMASCQKNNVLPVMIETENNFSWSHARDIGVQFTDVMGEVINEKTGEIEEGVIAHNGFFLYFDTNSLFKKYGKWDYKNNKELSKPNREVACLEDIAKLINDLLKKQANGELPRELCFIWDSVGSIPSYGDLISDTGNNMFAAAAVSKSFSIIVDNKIPASRSIDSEFTNTFFTVNKVWKNSMGHGSPVLEVKGGITMGFAPRLKIQLGGVESAGVKKLKATRNGKDYYYGIQTKIKVDKNHINGITYEGEICSTPHGFVNPAKLDVYKKEKIQYLLKQLDAETSSDGSDIKFESIEDN